MTFGEFISWAYKQGIGASEEIRYIDFNGEPEEVSRDDDGDLEIS